MPDTYIEKPLYSPISKRPKLRRLPSLPKVCTTRPPSCFNGALEK